MDGNLGQGNIWRSQKEELNVLSCFPNSTKAGRLEVLDEGADIKHEALVTSSQNLCVRSDLSLICGFSQNLEKSMDLTENLVVRKRHALRSTDDDNTAICKAGSSSTFLSRLLRLAPSELEFPSKDTLHFEGVSKPCIQWSKTSKPFKYKTLPCSRDVSSLKVLNSDRRPVKFLTYLNDETDQNRLNVTSEDQFMNSKFTRLEEGNYSNNNYSTVLAYGKNINSHQSAINVEETSISLYLRNNEGAQRLHDPSTSNISLPAYVGEQELMRSEFGVGLSLFNSSHEKTSNIFELPHGYHPLYGVPMCSVHHAETCRFTTFDAGITTFPANKELMVDQSPARSQASAGDVRIRNTEFYKQDTNQEAHGLLHARSSVYRRGSSTSITNSLEAERLSHVEQSAKITSTQHVAPVGQPNNRWVKRLKTSGPDYLALHAKNSKMGDGPSGERVNEFCHKIVTYSSTSERMSSKPPDEEHLKMNRDIAVLRNCGPTVDTAKNQRDLYLSHPWIRRWRHTQAQNQRTKPAEPMIWERKSSKPAVDESKKKQLPSIFAMALMGKASNCFRPCEFRRKGSVIVWHTESSR